MTHKINVRCKYHVKGSGSLRLCIICAFDIWFMTIIIHVPGLDLILFLKHSCEILSLRSRSQIRFPKAKNYFILIVQSEILNKFSFLKNSNARTFDLRIAVVRKNYNTYNFYYLGNTKTKGKHNISYEVLKSFMY